MVTSPFRKPPEETCNFPQTCTELATVAISRLQHGNAKMRVTVIFSVDDPPQNHGLYCPKHGSQVMFNLINGNPVDMPVNLAEVF